MLTLNRVSLQDQEYRAALEADLMMKEAKMEMLRREKEEFVEEVSMIFDRHFYNHNTELILS